MLFICAQVVGLVITREYLPIRKGVVAVQELPDVAGFSMERPDVAPQEGFLIVTMAIIIGTVIMLGIVSLGWVWLWNIWFFVSVSLLLHIALAPFISYSLFVAVVLAALKTWKKSSLVHNATEILLYGGLAAIFVPILKSPWVVLALLGVLSVYDFIAVWKTKHMVKMAEFQMANKTFGGLMLQYGRGKKHGKGKVTGGIAILGGGDIGFPLLFLGTILYERGMTSSLVALLFVVAALSIMLWQSEKGKYYPAMPFLTVGCLVGFAVSFLV